nr:immunoglobulin light chain junction region [Macaca mulatta]MPN66773.1 immunoglobulin light chain junction region [Macaca mulatta]MPN67001.1 immunoglobulin light chain junction region [Macaca mulatta]MPN67110.1 immunoglobulin light chain junction region [Macaca mulatta]MPN67160.1 immunoglobulin light chain junction region [Macaca mulatta]
CGAWDDSLSAGLF